MDQLSRRIVLRHTTGQFAGLRQILGTEEQLKTERQLDALPATVNDVQMFDHTGTVALARTTRRYALYVENRS